MWPQYWAHRGLGGEKREGSLGKQEGDGGERGEDLILWRSIGVVTNWMMVEGRTTHVV